MYAVTPALLRKGNLSHYSLDLATAIGSAVKLCLLDLGALQPAFRNLGRSDLPTSMYRIEDEQVPPGPVIYVTVRLVADALNRHYHEVAINTVPPAFSDETLLDHGVSR